jgi:DNA modification methylase
VLLRLRLIDYGLRNYNVNGQIGLEETPEEYVGKIVEVFREIWRVLKDNGTVWLNLGDSYAGSNQGHGTKNPSEKQWSNSGTHFMIDKKINRLPQGLKPKDLIGIPWRIAFALQAEGWYLRSDIIWSKTNPMPESMTDRPTKSHEYIFLLSKSAKYYYDNKAIKEPTVTNDNNLRNRDNTKLNNTPGRSKMGGLVKNNYELRNKRSVWTVANQPYSSSHFATFPSKLIEPCVLAGSREDDIVLDPFAGSGTTGVVCSRFNRRFIGLELNKQYCNMAVERIDREGSPLFNME